MPLPLLSLPLFSVFSLLALSLSSSSSLSSSRSALVSRGFIVVEVGATLELVELDDRTVEEVEEAGAFLAFLAFLGLPQSVCAASLRPPGPLGLGWDRTYSP